MSDEYRAAKDPRGLSLFLVALLYLDLVSAALLTIFNVFDFYAADTGLDSIGRAIEAYPDILPLMMMVVGGANLVLPVVVAITILVWIYRVNANAQTLTDTMESSPGWTVGWYFVPIANLWKPFKGLEEAWLVSADPRHWRDLKTPSILRWWWALWLGVSMANGLWFRLDSMAETPHQIRFAGAIGLVVDVILLALIVVFIEIVRALSTNQSIALSLPARLASAPIRS